MSTSLDTDIDTEFQIIVESMEQNDDGCEADHNQEERPECSIEITHVAYTACGQYEKVCTNSAMFDLIIQKLGGICICQRPVQECWTIRPI